jgi:hypothetical protein
LATRDPVRTFTTLKLLNNINKKVMTTVEINNKIAALESEVSSLSIEKEQLEKAVDGNVKEVLRTYLKAYNVFTDGFTIGEKSSGTSWYISRTREENGYERDEMTIYLKESYGGSKPDFVEALQPSFYTTSEISRYELERMVMIGKIGTMLLEKEKTILETINQVRDEHKEQISNIGSLIWDKEKEVSELRRQLSKLVETELLSKALDEGVEFARDAKYDRYKSIEIGRHKLYNIKKLKATLIGKGIFCNLEVTEAHPEKDVTYVFGKVKTESLKEALTYHRERIIS